MGFGKAVNLILSNARIWIKPCVSQSIALNTIPHRWFAVSNHILVRELGIKFRCMRISSTSNVGLYSWIIGWMYSCVANLISSTFETMRKSMKWDTKKKIFEMISTIYHSVENQFKKNINFLCVGYMQIFLKIN